jgi:hypothetical protein
VLPIAGQPGKEFAHSELGTEPSGNRPRKRCIYRKPRLRQHTAVMKSMIWLLWGYSSNKKMASPQYSDNFDSAAELPFEQYLLVYTV